MVAAEAILFRVLAGILVAAQAAIAQSATYQETGTYEPPVIVIFSQPIPGTVMDPGKEIIEISVHGLGDRHVDIVRNGETLHR
jgi:hypothetical protein